MSMAKLNPLRDEEWSTSSSHRAPSSRQLQTRGHQQDRRQPPHNQQQRTTTTVMRHTTVRQLHRQPRQAREGAASSSDPRFTAQDWKNWIKAQSDNNKRPVPRTIITAKSTPQSKGRPPATQVAQLAIKSAPTSAAPASSPSSSKAIDRTQIAGVVDAMQDIAALTVATPSSRAASGATSLPSRTLIPSSSGQGALNPISTAPKPVMEDSIVVEDLLALGPSETNAPSTDKERVPEAMADLIDLDFSITIDSKQNNGAVDNLLGSQETKDLGDLLKPREDPDHPWKTVKGDRMDITLQEDQEVELIDFSDDVVASVPVTAAQSDDLPASVPITTGQIHDFPISISTTVVHNNDSSIGPAIATVQSESGDYADSDFDSDSDSDSDGSEDGHEDPWTTLDNGGILVRLESLEEVKTELDRACYAWEDVLARIKI
ncbi:hypothetical protein BGZ72_000315 [Mortierella alpina]|nr:hypothetical protein BGZ72_000315 [Mortierella alpina]